jgi:membrane-bound metal-dependent hydrolase YbcI (DUF457 family)
VPVTPFHCGVGVLAKGVAPGALSVCAFVASQVVIDLESAYYLFVAREWPVHRWMHTFLGGTGVGVLAGLALWTVATRARAAGGLFASDLGLRQCVVGGLLGGATHPLLDGMMHADVRPFLPFAAGNPFLGLLSLRALHLLCIVAGLVGLSIVGLRALGRDPGKGFRSDPE